MTLTSARQAPRGPSCQAQQSHHWPCGLGVLLGRSSGGAAPCETCHSHGHTDATLGHTEGVCEPPSVLCWCFMCGGMAVYREDAKCGSSGCSSDLTTEALSPRFPQATFGSLNCLFLLFLRALL